MPGEMLEKSRVDSALEVLRSAMADGPRAGRREISLDDARAMQLAAVRLLRDVAWSELSTFAPGLRQVERRRSDGYYAVYIYRAPSPVLLDPCTGDLRVVSKQVPGETPVETVKRVLELAGINVEQRMNGDVDEAVSVAVDRLIQLLWDLDVSPGQAIGSSHDPAPGVH